MQTSPITWQESLLRGSIRRLLKPALSPRLPIAVQRRWMEIIARTTLKPGKVRYARGHLGGTPCETVTARANPGSDPAGTLLFLHGGAYILGGAHTHRNLTGHLARATGRTVYALDYRLAPEHPFPAALDDAVAAYRALLQAGHAPDSIAFAGDSAGGGLVLATALKLKELGEPQPGALVTFSPWTDLTISQPGSSDNEVMISSGWGKMAAGHYCGPLALDSPLLSPVYADLSGLPPLLIQVGSHEMLLPDSERLLAAAEKAGVTATLRVYERMWHVFQMHAGVLAAADLALAEVARFLRQPVAAGEVRENVSLKPSPAPSDQSCPAPGLPSGPGEAV